MLRGVMTFFGHPLFTAMTGIGLAVASALQEQDRPGRRTARRLRRGRASCTWPSTPRRRCCRARGLLLMYLVRRPPAGDRGGRLHRPPGPPRGPADPVPAGRLRPPRLAAGRTIRSPLSRLRTRGRALWHARLPRTRRLAGHHPVAAGGHRAGLPPRRHGARPGRQRPASSGRSCCCTRSYACAAWPWCRPSAGRRTRAPATPRPSTAHPRTRQRAFPARPVWAATTRRRPATGATATRHRPAAPLGQTATQYSEVDPTWKPPAVS